MELKQDCVREVLLYLEKNCKLNDFISSSQIEIDGFSTEDITYTLNKLEEGSFVNIVSRDLDGDMLIKDITYHGHQFLDNIRDKNIWTETKTKVSKVKSVSLSILEQVAAQIITSKLGY